MDPPCLSRDIVVPSLFGFSRLGRDGISADVFLGDADELLAFLHKPDEDEWSFGGVGDAGRLPSGAGEGALPRTGEPDRSREAGGESLGEIDLTCVRGGGGGATGLLGGIDMVGSNGNGGFVRFLWGSFSEACELTDPFRDCELLRRGAVIEISDVSWPYDEGPESFRPGEVTILRCGECGDCLSEGVCPPRETERCSLLLSESCASTNLRTASGRFCTSSSGTFNLCK
jgi:hypothetical protein